MYCNQCGKEIPKNSKFCNKCGAPVIEKNIPKISTTHIKSSNVHSNYFNKMEKQININTFIKNKKVIMTTIISAVVIVFTTIVTCSIYSRNMEIHKRHLELQTLEAIEKHIENEEYEHAFDKINSGYITDGDIEKYLEIVIPHMLDTFKSVRKSETDDLTLIVDGTEYYISDSYYSTIYTYKSGEKDILYEAEDTNYYLDMNHMISTSLDYQQSMYANNCIFFIETHHHSDMTLSNGSETYVFKYIDLNTRDVETIASDSYYQLMYKLEDGSIFVNFGSDSCEGVRYNPYTKSKKIGIDVVSQNELDNAIYRNSKYNYMSYKYSD